MSKKPALRLYNLFLKPFSAITDTEEYHKASLTIQLSLFLTAAIGSGVIYMSFYSTNPQVGIVLLFAQGGLFLSYLLSRTRFYKKAGLMIITILSLIPLFDVIIITDRSAPSLMILLIWNSLTIIFATSLISFRLLILFFCINIITILFFPLYLADVSFHSIFIPLLFNIILPLNLIIFSRYDRRTEERRLNQILDVNARLEKELRLKTKMEEKLVYNATHDALTKLPNRAVLRDRIEHLIHYYKRHENLDYAVIFIDLDRFKTVNDTLGHNMGDRLLIEVGNRLKSTFREQDTITRLGGDEFVLLLEDIESIEEIIHILERLRETMNEPVVLGNETLHVSASMGIVMGDHEETNPDVIIGNADIAMYRAKKRSGFSFEFYDDTMLNSIKSLLDLESRLRKGIEKEEFLILYQPIICTRTKITAGYEALIRWKDSNGKMISPADFIPIAEETGLIIPIGYWIIEQVCRQIKEWQALHTGRDFFVSVNLSNKQFEAPDFIERVKAIIEGHRIESGFLKFELTESLIVEKSQETGDQLSLLRKMGCPILIDDFGTGYSSLSYLHSLPIDILKIDRSFVNTLSNRKKNIVNTIINLAHSLNVVVVAEGIETEEQLNLVKSMNCEYIQGYYFSRPVDSRKAEHFLK